MRELAVRAWLSRIEAQKKESDERPLRWALIANDPERWLPVFYPEVDKPIEASEFIDDDGIPNFDGVQVKWADDVKEDEAKSILDALFGEGGVLTGENPIT